MGGGRGGRKEEVYVRIIIICNYVYPLILDAQSLQNTNNMYYSKLLYKFRRTFKMLRSFISDAVGGGEEGGGQVE